MKEVPKEEKEDIFGDIMQSNVGLKNKSNISNVSEKMFKDEEAPERQSSKKDFLTVDRASKSPKQEVIEENKDEES